MDIGDKIIFLMLLTFAITPNLGFFSPFSFLLLSILMVWLMSIYLNKNKDKSYKDSKYTLLHYFTLYILLISAFFYGGLYQSAETIITGRILMLLFIGLFLFKKYSIKTALIFYLIISFLTLLGSPAPKCDCFTTVKEAGLKFISGENPYNSIYSPVYPGKVINYFYHLPFSFLFTLPFTLIFGDPRVSIIFSNLIIIFLLKNIFGKSKLYKFAAITFLFSPRSFYILEHMYQEPNIFLFYVAFTYFLIKKKPIIALFFLLLFFSFKIHLVILLPFLLPYLKKYFPDLIHQKKQLLILSLPIFIPLYFFMIDPHNFIRNTIFFIQPTTIAAPIYKSLSFTTFIKSFFPGYSLYYSLVPLIPFWSLISSEKRLHTRFFLALFATHYFLGYSFFNHYYLVFLLAIFSLYLDIQKLSFEK